MLVVQIIKNCYTEVNDEKDPKTVAKKWKISKKSELQNIAYFNYANLRYYMGSDYFFFV